MTMVASAAQMLLPLTLALIIVLAAVIWFASHAKKNLGERAPAAHVGATSEPLQVSDECAAHIRTLSSEPLLLKQTKDGLRVQIANRPIVPVALFAEKGVASALMVVAAQASRSFGQVWVALVSLGDDNSISLRRLT